MIKPEQVPKEVLFAFGEALYMNSATDAEAIAAALNAWEGMLHVERNDDEFLHAHLILPLQQENSND